MQTVVLDPLTPEAAALIDSRRSTGADRFDEVWEGVYHMNAAPRGRHSFVAVQIANQLAVVAEPRGLVTLGETNIGDPDDFRIPDVTVHRGDVDLDAVWYPTAALVVEVLSPGDDTLDKLPFYAARGVGEAVVVDPVERAITWLRSDGARWSSATHSKLLGIDVAAFAEAVRWSPAT